MRLVLAALAAVTLAVTALTMTASTARAAGPCVTTAADGSCGPYYDRHLTGSNGFNTYVQNNVWSPVPGWHSKLISRNPGNFTVVANMPRGNTGVVSYSNAGQIESDPRNDQVSLPLKDYASIHSAFTENMHATGQTDAEAAYDIWLNDYNTEIMIQTDNTGGQAASCGTGPHPVFGGLRGIPRRQWTFCNLGDELIFQLPGQHVRSTSVPVLAMLNWLAGRHFFKNTATLTAIGYGWEICSTGGVNETFHVSRYTITATYKKGI